MSLSRPLCFAAALAVAGCVPGNDLTQAPPSPATATASAAPAPPPLPSGRLPATARPLRYDVALAIDPGKDRFTGDVVIQLDVPAATQAIVLHGRDLAVSRAEAIADGQRLVATVSTRAAAGSREAPEELVLTLARPLRAGSAELRIAYSAPLGDRLSGLYRVKADGAFYAFTQLEPTDARRVLPCFDEPSFKVPFELKVTTPKGNLVVANAEEIERVDADEGRSTMFRFAPTAPLPTYLFALAVGPLEIRDGPAGPVKIRLVTTKGKAALGDAVLEAASAHTRLLGEYFDRPYPYAKLDLLAVPEFGFVAMENAGLITFREDLILLDGERASADARRVMATNVAHEISHHWFGDLVTMRWWDDLWLNEGFATWMEARIVDAWRPATDARLSALHSKGAIMDRDALGSARAVRQPIIGDPEDAFDEITYDKGAAVLGMLEAWLGPDVFRAGVRGYLKAHEHGSATAADLFQALGAASGRDVAPVASTFLDQPGVPLVRAELVCDAGAAPRVKLAQSRYRAPEGAAPQTWKIPICVAYQGGKAPACGLMEGPTTEIALPAGRCPKWIYPNAEENGYYRFALPPAQMTALAGAVRSLDPRSRIGLVDDAWALVESGDLAAGALLDLLDGMKRERNRMVVEAMIAALEGLDRTLVDEAARPGFRRYASSILLPLAKELGWDAKKGEPDDHRLLRRSVLSALATLAEDPWLAAQAEKRAAQFLRDPRAVDLDIAAIALHASTRHAGDKRFAELEAAAKRARSPEERIAAIGALGSFADPALLRRALDLVLTPDLRVQDAFYVVNGAMRWPEARPAVLAWVRARFPELHAKMPDFVVTRIAGVVASICDPGARDEAARFFGKALEGAEGGDRALRQGLETAGLCIEVRAREAAKAKKRFGGSASRSAGIGDLATRQ